MAESTYCNRGKNSVTSPESRVHGKCARVTDGVSYAMSPKHKSMWSTE
jgi:hypothetical protein